jgi:hypothetical protein
MTKVLKTLVGIAAWQNLFPIYLFLTGDSMKRIIGHTCAASAKVVSLADATRVSYVEINN